MPLNGRRMPGAAAREVSVECRRHEAHVGPAFFRDLDMVTVDNQAAVVFERPEQI